MGCVILMKSTVFNAIKANYISQATVDMAYTKFISDYISKSLRVWLVIAVNCVREEFLDDSIIVKCHKSEGAKCVPKCLKISLSGQQPE